MLGQIKSHWKCDVSELSFQQDLLTGAALCEAIFSLQDQALEKKVGTILASMFSDLEIKLCSRQSLAQSGEHDLVLTINSEMVYLLSGKNGRYNEQDLNRLNIVAALTAQLLAAKFDFLQGVHHGLRGQIFDQLHDSIITMDLAGFIISWNRGAEKLLGYSASEVIGKNIIFLFEDVVDELSDMFAVSGGREMEVRRRKGDGDICWVRMSVSPLINQQDRPIGLIGYLSDVTERKVAEERINHLAYFDALTDLPNRTYFKKMLDSRLEYRRADEELVAVLFIDLNRFKPINDALGHQLGNVVLKQVADRFLSVLGAKDVLARLTSDEFAVAMMDIKQHFDITLLAEKILATLGTPFLVEGHELNLGASIGISLFPQDGVDSEQLLQTADVAMFKAKRLADRENGNYLFYCSEMNRVIAHRLELEAALRRALFKNEFFLLYQPKVCVKSGLIIGAEGLIRWRRSTGLLVAPTEFIQTAEESDLILQIDSVVMDMACAQAFLWQQSGIKPFRIAVNVSAKEFTSALAQRVSAALMRHQISPEWLELEITESMLMHSADAVVAIMHQITALGVSLALDDFGTGFSSFSYLKRFPIASLKIDRSFIQGIPDAADDCAIVSAILSMSKQLSHKVVAEGVEKSAQFDFLRSQGCQEVQGYLFSQPLSASEFTDLLIASPVFKLPS
jgi:diguanylate cyclase (GGDEF)-like protein/PAS domain S-box-containing protein